VLRRCTGGWTHNPTDRLSSQQKLRAKKLRHTVHSTTTDDGLAFPAVRFSDRELRFLLSVNREAGRKLAVSQVEAEMTLRGIR
jgi:hypothetical protein